ncbi:MAG: flagellar type III secretion system pore protein FliP [Candidatus Delongbacteria bacterium]
MIPAAHPLRPGRWSLRRLSFVVAIGLTLILLLALPGLAQAPGPAGPSLSLTVGGASSPKPDFVVAIEILFLMTLLALAPAILILGTSFTRILIVLHFLRQALGTQQLPPNQVLIGLSLFLTFFIMRPSFDRMNQDALQPYLARQITQKEAIAKAQVPFKEFMLTQARTEDLALFVRLAKLERPTKPADLPITVVMPGFLISELRMGFQIGFLIYLPFLVIDLVVASVLMSMGMLMLSPIMISLPFKILLFVLVDGWNLLVRSLVEGFR